MEITQREGKKKIRKQTKRTLEEQMSYLGLMSPSWFVSSLWSAALLPTKVSVSPSARHRESTE